MTTTAINHSFIEFEEIYNERHKYNLEWAYNDAQEKLNSFRDNIINGRLKKKCILCSGKFDKDLAELGIQNRKTLKKHKWYARIFSKIYSVLSLIEVALSVALVMIISNLSHTGEEMMQIEALGFWIGLTFAFLKVFIERYFLKPYIEKLGWKLYQKSFITLREYSKSINEQVSWTLFNQEMDQQQEVA